MRQIESIAILGIDVERHQGDSGEVPERTLQGTGAGQGVRESHETVEQQQQNSEAEKDDDQPAREGPRQARPGLAAVDLLVAFQPVWRQFVKPGGIDGQHKANGQAQQHGLRYPARKIQDGRHHVDDLQYHPGDGQVGNTRPDDVSAFQFPQKFNMPCSLTDRRGSTSHE